MTTSRWWAWSIRPLKPRQSAISWLARILQDRLAAADHDRQFVTLHLEAIEQVPHVRITVDVQVLERVAVAREECLDAERCRGVGRANEQHVADPLRD